MKLLWSNPEGRVLAAKTPEMVLHVGRLNPPLPEPGAEVPQATSGDLRPIDWSSALRIVGPGGMQVFVERLVDACWPDVSKVALLYANNPDKWPARTTFRDDAAARGTVRSMVDRSSPMTPLERLGFGDLHTHDLSAQIKAGGKFANLEDLCKRVPRLSLPFVKRQIVEQIHFELSHPGTGAMFFARTTAGTKFHGSVEPVARKDDDEDEGFRPGIRSRYR